jgi:hypothetical protein
VRILDPACGSGTFLYLALRRMLDLWREVSLISAIHGLPTLLPHQIHPSQLYGLGTNVYASRHNSALFGHSSSAITRETYIHSVPADAYQAVGDVEKLFGS